MLIVVPLEAAYALGSDTPTPYILSPYWGHHQVWTWLGYAHEVGHHAYRNVIGLRNELEINVAVELWKQGKSHDEQCIWFNWLEEIFADVFGLLRIGPPFAHTQRFMLCLLPEPVVRADLGHHLHRLLVASDISHPPPYLRMYLAIRALEELGYTEEVRRLKAEWDELFQDVDTSKMCVLVRGRHFEMPTEVMQKDAEMVLDVILNTELEALADKSNPLVPRTVKEVLFESLEENKVLAVQRKSDRRSSALSRN